MNQSVYWNAIRVFKGCTLLFCLKYTSERLMKGTNNMLIIPKRSFRVFFVLVFRFQRLNIGGGFHVFGVFVSRVYDDPVDKWCFCCDPFVVFFG